jgi:trans-feruloyl-CoA hydratase/vanillin synthase
MYYILTGDTFDGRAAERMRLVTFAHPLERLQHETTALAEKLIAKNPHTLTACKDAFKNAAKMDYALAEQYFAARSGALRAVDPDSGREGIRQFLDDEYKPGFEAYKPGG